MAKIGCLQTISWDGYPPLLAQKQNKIKQPKNKQLVLRYSII